jgi:hypothetical protein
MMRPRSSTGLGHGADYADALAAASESAAAHARAFQHQVCRDSDPGPKTGDYHDIIAES